MAGRAITFRGNTRREVYQHFVLLGASGYCQAGKPMLACTYYGGTSSHWRGAAPSCAALCCGRSTWTTTQAWSSTGLSRGSGSSSQATKQQSNQSSGNWAFHLTHQFASPAIMPRLHSGESLSGCTSTGERTTHQVRPSARQPLPRRTCLSRPGLPEPSPALRGHDAAGRRCSDPGRVASHS